MAVYNPKFPSLNIDNPKDKKKVPLQIVNPTIPPPAAQEEIPPQPVVEEAPPQPVVEEAPPQPETPETTETVAQPQPETVQTVVPPQPETAQTPEVQAEVEKAEEQGDPERASRLREAKSQELAAKGKLDKIDKEAVALTNPNDPNIVQQKKLAEQKDQVLKEQGQELGKHALELRSLFEQKQSEIESLTTKYADPLDHITYALQRAGAKDPSKIKRPTTQAQINAQRAEVLRRGLNTRIQVEDRVRSAINKQYEAELSSIDNNMTLNKEQKEEARKNLDLRRKIAESQLDSSMKSQEQIFKTDRTGSGGLSLKDLGTVSNAEQNIIGKITGQMNKDFEGYNTRRDELSRVSEINTLVNSGNPILLQQGNQIAKQFARMFDKGRLSDYDVQSSQPYGSLERDLTEIWQYISGNPQAIGKEERYAIKKMTKDMKKAAGYNLHMELNSALFKMRGKTSASGYYELSGEIAKLEFLSGKIHGYVDSYKGDVPELANSWAQKAKEIDAEIKKLQRLKILSKKQPDMPIKLNNKISSKVNLDSSKVSQLAESIKSSRAQIEGGSSQPASDKKTPKKSTVEIPPELQ